MATFRVFIKQPVAFDSDGIPTQFESFAQLAEADSGGQAVDSVRENMRMFGFNEQAYVSGVKLVKVFNQLGD